MSGIEIAKTWIPAGVKRILKNACWRAYGAFFANPPVPASPRSFLFICMGNICRSPFAEAAARLYFPDAHEMTFRSAGIVVNHPRESTPEAMAAAKTFGIDLAKHRSQKVDEDLVAAADMVFGMEAWHFRSLRKSFPRHREKIFLLAPFEGSAPVKRDIYDAFNIRDPYGRELADYISCFGRIDACLRGLFTLIRKF